MEQHLAGLLHAKRAGKLLSLKEWQSVLAITPGLSPKRLGRVGGLGHCQLQTVCARAADAEDWRVQEAKAEKEEKRRWKGIHAGDCNDAAARVQQCSLFWLMQC